MFNKKGGGKAESAKPIDRVADEADLKTREDRVGRYFEKHLNKFVFDELSESYLAKAGIADIMKGVPIPLRKRDIESFRGGSGLSAPRLADNMALVMGADPHFEYVKDYAGFLNKLYSGKIHEGMLKKGRDAAEKGDLERACIYFRATLCMDPVYLHGMYSYARACRAMYLESGDEEFVGRFKAEALEYFELTTEAHPKFAEAYYYLGYAYLNIGLYLKAELAWKGFLDKSQNPKDKMEIRERLIQIAEPVRIEQGCNMVLSERFEQGLKVLKPFMETRYRTWWPLSYYLGVCCIRLGKRDEAMANFKNVLKLNASHIETMQELAAIYAEGGDAENEAKYRKKIEIVKGG